ncbi:MAG: hypothetical protein H0Z18_06800 [Thermococcus sp.]|uniref:hypothetical protein n=1 Tax=Thermococcus sp. TaxID=35749 RepID=UPI001DC0BF74|nr:hypothetical protein [Thermococcus sp.]MBO8174949.1 hypothetical protein [Thermococcus sp.]
MKIKYWVVIFILYVFLCIPLSENEKIGSFEIIGFIILLTAFYINQKVQHKHREPYILGNSSNVEYLSQKELVKRVKGIKDPRGDIMNKDPWMLSFAFLIFSSLLILVIGAGYPAVAVIIVYLILWDEVRRIRGQMRDELQKIEEELEYLRSEVAKLNQELSDIKRGR